MLVVPVVRRQERRFPATPPPGPIDVALSLLVHQAFPLSRERQQAMLLRLGSGGRRPCKQAEVARAFGCTQQWVAQLEHRVRELAGCVGSPESLRRGLEQFASGQVQTAGSAALALYQGAPGSGDSAPVQPCGCRRAVWHIGWLQGRPGQSR